MLSVIPGCVELTNDKFTFDVVAGIPAGTFVSTTKTSFTKTFATAVDGNASTTVPESAFAVITLGSTVNVAGFEI